MDVTRVKIIGERPEFLDLVDLVTQAKELPTLVEALATGEDVANRSLDLLTAVDDLCKRILGLVAGDWEEFTLDQQIRTILDKGYTLTMSKSLPQSEAGEIEKKYKVVATDSKEDTSHYAVDNTIQGAIDTISVVS